MTNPESPINSEDPGLTAQNSAEATSSDNLYHMLSALPGDSGSSPTKLRTPKKSLRNTMSMEQVPLIAEETPIEEGIAAGVQLEFETEAEAVLYKEKLREASESESSEQPRPHQLPEDAPLSFYQETLQREQESDGVLSQSLEELSVSISEEPTSPDVEQDPVEIPIDDKEISAEQEEQAEQEKPEEQEEEQDIAPESADEQEQAVPDDAPLSISPKRTLVQQLSRKGLSDTVETIVEELNLSMEELKDDENFANIMQSVSDRMEGYIEIFQQRASSIKELDTLQWLQQTQSEIRQQLTTGQAARSGLNTVWGWMRSLTENVQERIPATGIKIPFVHQTAGETDTLPAEDTSKDQVNFGDEDSDAQDSSLLDVVVEDAQSE